MVSALPRIENNVLGYSGMETEPEAVVIGRIGFGALTCTRTKGCDDCRLLFQPCPSDPKHLLMRQPGQRCDAHRGVRAGVCAQASSNELTPLLRLSKREPS